MFGLALKLLQMFELVLAFGNWEIFPQNPHFQLLKDLKIYLAPTLPPTQLSCMTTISVPTLHSTHNTYLGPENNYDLNDQLAHSGSQSPGAWEDHICVSSAGDLQFRVVSAGNDHLGCFKHLHFPGHNVAQPSC